MQSRQRENLIKENAISIAKNRGAEDSSSIKKK
jgi:hypothetical protein